jgi:hypothetical protein
VEPGFPNRELHGESFLGFVAVAAAIWKSRFLSCDLRGESFSGFVAVAAAISKSRFLSCDMRGKSFLGFVAVAVAIWKSRFLSCDMRGESFSGFVAVAVAIWKSRFLSCDMRGKSFLGFVAVAVAISKSRFLSQMGSGSSENRPSRSGNLIDSSPWQSPEYKHLQGCDSIRRSSPQPRPAGDRPAPSAWRCGGPWRASASNRTAAARRCLRVGFMRLEGAGVRGND